MIPFLNQPGGKHIKKDYLLPGDEGREKWGLLNGCKCSGLKNSFETTGRLHNTVDAINATDLNALNG